MELKLNELTKLYEIKHKEYLKKYNYKHGNKLDDFNGTILKIYMPLNSELCLVKVDKIEKNEFGIIILEGMGVELTDFRYHKQIIRIPNFEVINKLNKYYNDYIFSGYDYDKLVKEIKDEYNNYFK